GTLGGSAPAREPGRFTLNLQKSRRIELDELATSYGNDDDLVLVDTRTQPEFFGMSFDYQPRVGHIPGAVNVTFDSLYKDLQSYVDKNKYNALIPKAVSGAKSIVTYCEVGVRAAATALLHEIYTDQIVRVYDGSIMEWSSKMQLPITQR
ncbi:MAG: hypothetical protein KGS72_25445, partial [Cyanobacteria bacterium REEB67]|nr:hypothetical protein [Cyanobacteria bacterium REEB67]